MDLLSKLVNHGYTKELLKIFTVELLLKCDYVGFSL